MVSFKVWNQGNDGSTMGIRAADVDIVDALAAQINVSSDDGVYASLRDYLTALAVATAPPPPYRRPVDVFWKTYVGYGRFMYFTDRVLEVTYTGRIRRGGGFAAQCYVVVDPQGYAALGAHHTVPINVLWVPGGEGRDLLEVTV